ncbi:hypothetical protein B0H14DRAFT_2572505 [Mycena olivaceomarginata]|nr:hypothetical protein B0H14DRAFT_2572505 [Mycena olivaceomarginata]
MVACALRNIQIGEELVFDYGRDFWEGSCPCKTCNMAQSSTPLVAQQQTPITAAPIVPATEVEQLERQRMRPEKAERERQRKKKGLRDYRLRSRFDVGRITVEWQVVAA